MTYKQQSLKFNVPTRLLVNAALSNLRVAVQLLLDPALSHLMLQLLLGLYLR